MERDKLLGTMDAKVWTDEFMATKARLGNKEFDHTMMLSWFANAIMAGFDEANRRAQRALDVERHSKQCDMETLTLKFTSQLATIQAQLAGLKRNAGLDCGDQSCLYAVEHTGMRTNGGCRCDPKRMKDDLVRSRKACDALQARCAHLDVLLRDEYRPKLDVVAVQRSIADRDSRIDALEREVEKLDDDKETLQAQVKQLDRTLADVYQQRDGLQAQLRQVEGERDEWERKCRDLCQAHGVLLIEHHDVKKDLTTLRQLVEALQRENECKDTLIETLQAQLAQRGKDGENE